MPTNEQNTKIIELQQLGFKWDKQMSISAAGVIMKKDSHIWFFGLNGEIIENLEKQLHIKL